MSHRPRPPKPAADVRDGGKAAGASQRTSIGLADLRRQLREHGSPAADAAAQRPAAPSPRGKQIRHPVAHSGAGKDRGRSAPAEAGASPDEAELALFRRTVGAIEPVRGGNRAELERPRPAPVPRAPQAADEASEATPPRAELDPLRAAYAGVVPLRDSGRAELDTPQRHHHRSQSAQPTRIQRPDAIVLPANAELSDPASLFRAVVGDARPVDDRNRVQLERPAPPPAPVKREADERAALDESLAAPLTFEDRLDMGDEAAFLRPGLPRRVLTDLRRGRWVLQAQIDLHGLTRDEARAALARFLHDSLGQGQRCIRVIHGKGHGSPGKVPILKQLSRGWLAQREEILAFCQAGPHHGGGGALLVLLRAQNAASR